MTAARATPFSGPTLLAGGVVLAVAVASFMRAPLLPDIGRDLRITAAGVAMITTAFALGRLVMDLPAGRLADRLPPGRALAGTGVGVAVSAALLATAQSFAQALAGVFLLGIASSLTNTTGMTLFATSAPPERRGTAGVLSDRISRKAALVPSLLGMAAAVLLLAPPPTVLTWLTAIVLLSVTSSGIAVAATIIADRVPPETVGRRLGTFRFTGDFGLLAGPAVTGLLYEHGGRAAAMLATAAVLGGCALAAGLLIAEPRP